MAAENATLVAVMEVDAARAEALRVKYGAARAYTDANALVADPSVEAVYIASPVVYHAAQARAAAASGKHLLLEKPLAMTAGEADALLAYCDAAGVRVGAGLMMRFGTHVRTMRSAVAAGRIGTIVSGYAQFTLWCPPEAGNWRLDKSLSGGGCLMDMGIHCLDLFCHVTGMKARRVAALHNNVVFPYGVEDVSTVVVEMENGAACVVQTNFNIPDAAAKWRFELFGTRGRLLGENIIGQNDGGTLNAVFLGDPAAYDERQDHADDAGVMLPGEFGNLYTREIESFSDSILNGTPLAAPATAALAAQRLIERAYAEDGKIPTLDS